VPSFILFLTSLRIWIRRIIRHSNNVSILSSRVFRILYRLRDSICLLLLRLPVPRVAVHPSFLRVMLRTTSEFPPLWKGWMPRSLLFLFPPIRTYLTIDRSHDRLYVLYVNMANHYPLTPELRASPRPVTECFNASTSPVNTEHLYPRYSPSPSISEPEPYFTPTRHSPYFY
jgi:hypothetical protein